MARWLEASPSVRIRGRNLFHPKRGAKPQGDSPESATGVVLPTLTGTQTGVKVEGALLRWPGRDEATFLKVGESVEGFRLESVTRERAILVNLSSGQRHTLEFEWDRGEVGGGHGELESVLKMATRKDSRKS